MRILDKKILVSLENSRVVKLDIESPEIAKKAKPGQFILLMASEKGERIPLTVVDTDLTKRSITLIVQEVGYTTRLLGGMNIGDSLYSLVGPLGHATEIKRYGTVILVGGGVGIAEIYPVAKAFKAVGNQIITILGSRTRDQLILESELTEQSDRLFIATDDGSYGKKGFTTDVLKDLLDGKDKLERVDLIYAVGPIPMMHNVSKMAKRFKVKTLVSLNSLMVDGTGMCGGCRVTVGAETKFACVDGPEFDAMLVDWEGLIKRSRVYAAQEKHICNLKNIKP